MLEKCDTMLIKASKNKLTKIPLKSVGKVASLAEKCDKMQIKASFK